MGVYDREYIRREPSGRGGGGGGVPGVGFSGMRMLSVNTWLIIINVAVYLLDGFLAGSGVYMAVEAGRIFPQDLPAEVQQRAEVARDPQTNEPIAASQPTLTGQGYRLVDPQTGRTVGVQRVIPMTPLEAIGHFSTGKLVGLEVWRVITFQFLHANFTHLLFNMLGLFFFGALVERYLGSRRYLAFYLTCGVCGSLLYLLLNALGGLGLSAPGVLINDLYTPLIGASAGVFGILMACAYVAPNATILVMLIIPMRLATAAYLFTALAAFNLLTGGSNAGGDAAHLGGAIAGFLLIRNTHFLNDILGFFSSGPVGDGGARPARSRGSSGGGGVRGAIRRLTGGGGGGGGGAPDDREVDRILAKVNERGLHSLTEKERRTLRSATESRKR
jgi:membrane associated rhomboid family serine protease